MSDQQFAYTYDGAPPAAHSSVDSIAGGVGDACTALQPALSAYLDGELDMGEAGALLRHLDGCRACAERMEQYRRLGQGLRDSDAVRPPAGLALQLRVKASHFSVRGRRWLYWRLRLLSAFQALAVPAAVGTATALVLFSALAGGVLVAAAPNPLQPDVQVGMEAQPPRMTSMSNYGVGGPLLVEAQIDATGHVYGYSVLSGVLSAQLISRLNNQLLTSVFQPATTNFGQATTGSLLVSFGTVDVRG